MLIKGLGEMEIITSTINVHVHIEIQFNFIITSIENWFGDEEAIFQNDNASCQKKGI